MTCRGSSVDSPGGVYVRVTGGMRRQARCLSRPDMGFQGKMDGFFGQRESGSWGAHGVPKRWATRGDLNADRKIALKVHTNGLSNFSLAYYNAYVRGLAVTKQYGTNFEKISQSSEGPNWGMSVLGYNTRRREREWSEIHWHANGQEIGGPGGDSPHFNPPPG